MRQWLMAALDYPAMSCEACVEIERNEGVKPVCVNKPCPVAPPDGAAGVVSALFADLKAVGAVVGAQAALASYGLTPDRPLVALLRFLETTLKELRGRKAERLEFMT